MKSKLLVLSLALVSMSIEAQWSAGIATIGSATPYKGLSSETIVIPIVSYEGERLLWRGPSIQYKLTGLNRNEPSFRLSADLAPNELEADKSSALAGIDNRDFSFLIGIRYIYPSRFGEFSALLQTDATNKHDGQRGALNFDRVLLRASDRSWAFTGGVQLEYLSDNYTTYYFGVSQEESFDSGFAEYEVDAVLQGGITLGGYYQFAGNWQVTAQSRWLSLASDIKNSPIVNDSSSIDGFVGLTYQF